MMSRSEQRSAENDAGACDQHDVRVPHRFLLATQLVGLALLPFVARSATFTDANWMVLGLGVNGTVDAVTGSSSNLYLAGPFTIATNTDGAPVTVNYIANWNGSSWMPLGSGMVGGYVQALALSGTDLYAGGRFTSAGGNVANFTAKWNGSSWSPLGSGMNNHVFAVLVAGGDLYAGGEFSMAGGTSAASIAKWNGSTWSPLGSGLNSLVWALAAQGTNVYAGGAFTTAGGSPANRVARWNGSTWSSLGLGVNAIVRALAVSGSDLYVGGEFTWATNAGSAAVRANYVAKWNGSSWSPIGLGMNNFVEALAVSGSDLYVGGTFDRATNSSGISVAVQRIARWDGTNWFPLGSGLNGSVVNAAGISGNDLYVGGTFSASGGKPSRNISRAYSRPLPTLSLVQSGGKVNTLWPSTYSNEFTLEQNSGPTMPTGWTVNSGSITDDGTNRSVAVPITNDQQFFRLRR